MRKDFFTKNSRSILIISVLLGLWLAAFIYNKVDNSLERLLDTPKKGQIYIFQEGNFYAPMRLDSVSETELYLRNYDFLFQDAIPKLSQIKSSEFDSEFFAIYDKKEMERLFKAGNLVHIYP